MNRLPSHGLAVACLGALLAIPPRGVRAEPADASPADTNALVAVTLMTQWTPQAQFAGYYMAREKGLYRQRGLDVAIIRGGADRDQREYLRDGRADFVTLWLTTALVYRDEGLPLTHLAQVIKRSNLVLVGWKDRGIREIADMNGRRLGIWEGPFRPPFLTFLKMHGVKADIIQQNYSINLFLRRGVDACSAMQYNEYHMLYQAGVDRDELTVFPIGSPEDPLPEDGLYCLQATAKKRPELCRTFAEASMEGWRYAAAHREETLDVIMRYVREAFIPTNRAHMKWMLDTILTTIFPPEGSPAPWTPGELSAEDYRKTAAMLKRAGLIRKAPPFKSFVLQEGVRAP